MSVQFSGSMPINPVLLEYHEANRYDVIFNTPKLSNKMAHIAKVISFGVAIADAQHSDVDRDLLKICLEHHDDGRVNQMDLLGKFSDSDVSHNVLGLDRLDKFLQNRNAIIDSSVEILRSVILYHGRQMLVGDYLPDEANEYIEIVTAADDFENAVSCVSYLVREAITDEKNYIKNHPEFDQHFVPEFVFEHFKNGEKFDKNEHCFTYGAYVMFAATLATNCIKKYGDIAKVVLKSPGYGYNSILDGYYDVFKKTLTPEMAEDAYRILSDMVCNG